MLSNINLVVEPTQKVGIIGPSGGGKSTLLKLIPLFIEPTSGRILIDNVDIQSVSMKELRHRVAWISQTPQLFNESLRENLTDGDVLREILPIEIDQATGAAYVSEFASQMPGGLDSIVGEGGSTLSGGQKQRIAIARGLLKNAPIICMDEPTAALDSKSEKFIRDSIAKLIANKTVLMVTHRKALLSLMDVIYVMDGGSLHKISEYGGLDTYLQKISDSDTDSQELKSALATQAEQNQQALAELEVEKEQLEEKLSTIQQPGSPGGTIYIDH